MIRSKVVFAKPEGQQGYEFAGRDVETYAVPQQQKCRSAC